jgi:hypothetical protein
MLASAAVALLIGGCAASSEPEASRAAEDFYAAFTDRDGAAACSLLSPETRLEVAESAGAPCESAVLEEELPQAGDPSDVRVYGDRALVQFTADTVSGLDVGRMADHRGRVPTEGRPAV